jgi:hypothetical protein
MVFSYRKVVQVDKSQESEISFGAIFWEDENIGMLSLPIEKPTSTLVICLGRV